jgi:hypothetical protein
MVRRILTRLMPLGVAVALAGCGWGADSDEEPATRAENGSRPGKSPNRTEVAAPRGIAEPRRIEASGRVAATAVERTLGREVSPGQPVVIGARCDAGDCVVRFRSVPRGRGAVLSAQSEILRRLFARPGVRSVTLYVHHQLVGTPQKNEAPAFATTSCRREDHPAFAWRRIDANDITRVCRSTRVAGGRQRSLVKRGLLTNEEASRGRGRPRRGGPGGRGGRGN